VGRAARECVIWRQPTGDGFGRRFDKQAERYYYLPIISTGALGPMDANNGDDSTAGKHRAGRDSKSHAFAIRG
jgi:hypothetical protein